jgi:hypothetical protein
MMPGSWVRSSRCDNAHCVEVRLEPEGVLMRNNSDASQGILAFETAVWLEFIEAVKQGEYDR